MVAFENMSFFKTTTSAVSDFDDIDSPIQLSSIKQTPSLGSIPFSPAARKLNGQTNSQSPVKIDLNTSNDSTTTNNSITTPLNSQHSQLHPASSRTKTTTGLSNSTLLNGVTTSSSTPSRIPKRVR